MVLVGVRGGEVVRRRDPPLAVGRCEDGEVPGVGVAVAREVGEGHLPEEGEGGHGTCRAAGGEGADDLLRGDPVPVGRVAPQDLVAVLLGEGPDPAIRVSDPVETAYEKTRHPLPVVDHLRLRRLQVRASGRLEEEGLVGHEVRELRRIELQQVSFASSRHGKVDQPRREFVLHPGDRHPVPPPVGPSREGEEIPEPDLVPGFDHQDGLDGGGGFVPFRDHRDIPEGVSPHGEKPGELVVRRGLEVPA